MLPDSRTRGYAEVDSNDVPEEEDLVEQHDGEGDKTHPHQHHWQQHQGSRQGASGGVADDEKLTDSASDSLPEITGNGSSGDNATAANGAVAMTNPLRTSPTSIYAQSIGLHQRQRHFRQSTSNAADDDSSYYYQSDLNNNSSAHNNTNNRHGSPDNKYGKQQQQQRHYPAAYKHNNKKRSSICGTRTQSVLLAFGLAYLALALYMYRRVTTNTNDSSSYDNYYGDSERLVELVQQMEKLRLARAFLDEREANLRRAGTNRVASRMSTRSSRTRPATTNGSSLDDGVMFHSLQDADERRRMLDIVPTNTHPDSQPAPLEALCGFHAQNASLTFPDNYQSRDALGSRSRIIITGITDMLGIRLALLLRQRCHAHVVVAIDPTFPNTIPNRLRLLEPLQVLALQMPKLNIQWAYLGLDPLKRDKHVLLNATGELDIVQSFRPTHIVHLANFFQTTPYNNLQHPYVQSFGDQYRPSLYQIRSSLAAMEQLLMSMALMNDDRARPHYVYASSALAGKLENDDDTDGGILQSQTHMMQEIMADTYHSLYGVQSTAVRLPAAVFGPWHADDSPMHQVLAGITDNRENISSFGMEPQNFLFVDDAAEAFIAAMQFRSPNPTPFALEPAGRTSWQSVGRFVHSSVSSDTSAASAALIASPAAISQAFLQTRRYLSWFPRTALSDGMIRTVAWYLDQGAPLPVASASSNVTSSLLSGDGLLARHALETCPSDDPTCYTGAPPQYCASECASSDRCSTSAFDSMIDITLDVTEGCEIVLYTQLLDKDAFNLKLHTEYMDEGTPLICTVAFVAFESPLVEAVVQKVPEHEQVRLGIVPRPEDYGSQQALHNLKRLKLNGRLLYQGWILVWPDEVPNPLPHPLKYLLKLAPGRFLSKSVKQAVFIEESFGVSPKHDDIKFLVQELKRDALPKRTVKKKTPPKTKIRLPAEPARRAVILMSEIRHQESSHAEALWKDKVSIRQASRFMRYECGERTLGKESHAVKAQREFYERMVSFVNRNTMRSPLEPQYVFAMRHWARTRWVVHDVELVEGRQLRCDWYKEHMRWEGSHLDQLSFAYVMAKQELERRLRTEAELNDRGLKLVADWTEIKRLLTDVLEWHALTTERNKDYTPYGELTALPYDIVDSEEGNVEGSELADDPLLFARIISDRTMTMARKEWYSTNKSTRR